VILNKYIIPHADNLFYISQIIFVGAAAIMFSLYRVNPKTDAKNFSQPSQLAPLPPDWPNIRSALQGPQKDSLTPER
jgi:hypothetical protein